MSRRKAAVLSAVVVAACVLAAGAGAQRNPTLVELGGVRFPDRSYVLTLPQGVVVAPEQVNISENGKSVSGVSLTPAGATERTFGVVLAIDTSNSMRGAALESAMAAAREFAAHRGPNEKLGVVVFNGEVATLLPITTDAAAITRALSTTPETVQGTRLYDGVGASLDLLKGADVDAGAVIVLSDGADTRSVVLPTELEKQATSQRARIFSVALRSEDFDPAALKDLAARGGGEYAEARSPEDLEQIYGTLGEQLSHQYVLRYRSPSGAGDRVEVEVEVDGVPGTAVTGYVVPELKIQPAPPYHDPFLQRFWSSPAAMLVVIVLMALLVGTALAVVLKPTNRSLRDRMSEFVTLHLPERREKVSPLPERVFVGAERSLSRTPWWARFKQDLALAGLRIPPVQLVLWTVVATLGSMWLLNVILGNPVAALLALGIPFLVRMFIQRRVAAVRDKFAEQLPDNLQVIASALRAGHSLVGALSVVVEDTAEPSRSEFGRVVADEQLGIPLDQSLMRVALRMDNKDVEQVALVASLQRDTGGNTAEVLDRVTDTVRARFELRRLVKTLTAQGRMSRWVLSLLPVGLFAIILLINPDYMKPLFTHSSGRVLLAISVAMIVTGSLVIRKIVNIKV